MQVEVRLSMLLYAELCEAFHNARRRVKTDIEAHLLLYKSTYPIRSPVSKPFSSADLLVLRSSILLTPGAKSSSDYMASPTSKPDSNQGEKSVHFEWLFMVKNSH